MRSLGTAIAALLLGGFFLAVPALAQRPMPGDGVGNHCDGSDTGAPGQGGDHTPCEPTTLPPPTSPPPTSPPATSPPATTPTTAAPRSPDEPPIVPEVEGVSVQQIGIQEISNVLRRAFVAGESVRLSGKAPAGCDAILHVDGSKVGPIEATASGVFDVAVETSELAAGRHVAEVFCASPAARLLRTVFWVAAPQSSSNLFFVALGSLLVIYAIGWAGLRTLAGPTLAASAAKTPGTAAP